MNYFVTQKQVYTAANHWYGRWDIDHCCLAENRLAKGEVPYEGFYERTTEEEGH